MRCTFISTLAVVNTLTAEHSVLTAPNYPCHFCEPLFALLSSDPGPELHQIAGDMSSENARAPLNVTKSSNLPISVDRRKSPHPFSFPFLLFLLLVYIISRFSRWELWLPASPSHSVSPAAPVSVSVLEMFVVVELFFLLKVPTSGLSSPPPRVAPAPPVLSAGTSCYSNDNIHTSSC